MLAEELQSLLVQLLGERDDLDVRVSLDSVQQRDGCPTVAEFGESVANLQDYGAGSDQAPILRLDTLCQLDGSPVMLVGR